jgi:hypothetical protein
MTDAQSRHYLQSSAHVYDTSDDVLRHDVHLNTFNNYMMAGWILMKFVLDLTPLMASPNHIV